MLSFETPFRNLSRIIVFTCCLLGNLFPFAASAQVRLPRIFRDSMILQRNKPIAIWGWASPNERVTIRFRGQTYHARAGKDSVWKAEMKSEPGGGPYQLQIAAKNKISIGNVLIGEVWFCSGQSNMVHQMDLHSVRYAEEVATANFPQIRQFWIPTLTDLNGPEKDLPSGYWKSATKEDIGRFSAVAYFFARQLYEQYQVPIGIINASVGGTPIEAWTSAAALSSFPEIEKTITRNRDTAYVRSIRERQQAAMQHQQPPPADLGLTADPKWYQPSYQPQRWRRINIPGYWEDQGLGNLNGTVWYRREFQIPASMLEQPAKVFLGRIVDADELYINGIKVGATGYQYPQRRYAVPENVLKAGKNLFVVRVTNYFGKGGFVTDKPYQLIAGTDTIDLKGYWNYRVGQVFSPPEKGSFVPGINAQNEPSALFNAMVAPIIPYSIKGILWYQGESNAGHPENYAALQQAQIADWRKRWNEGDIPFLFVQLPNFMDYSYLPQQQSNWAEMREAQFQTLDVPNTGMAVAIDAGEWNDIHPDNKKVVGDRLALLARKIAYGEDIIASGPLFTSARVAGDTIMVHFSHTGDGLTTTDGEPPGDFAIAGADKNFVWAHTAILGDSVAVWSESVTAPMYVRYAWADNPEHPNLVNTAGLPASPFRTDNGKQ